MTVACSLPDPADGTILGFSAYVDCQSRALGENGYQALVGGSMVAAALTGFLTIYIALIGYRMVLGGPASVRDGIGWASRLGVVLALVTSWPAFSTLIYRVASDGPDEIAGIVLPAAGLSGQNVDMRVQRAYDIVRRGLPADQGQQAASAAPDNSNGASAPANASAPQGPAPDEPTRIAPAPLTAISIVLCTIGAMAALRVTSGILIAIAPFPIMGLLFKGTTGLFDGWMRALGGTVLAMVAVALAGSVELVAIEAEIAHILAVQAGAASPQSLDPVALQTIIALFALVVVVALVATFRVAGAFRLRTPILLEWLHHRQRPGRSAGERDRRLHNGRPGMVSGRDGGVLPRHTVIAGALANASARDQARVIALAAGVGGSPTGGRGTEALTTRTGPSIGIAGRRLSGARTRSAARRDRTA